MFSTLDVVSHDLFNDSHSYTEKTNNIKGIRVCNGRLVRKGVINKLATNIEKKRYKNITCLVDPKSIYIRAKDIKNQK